MDRVFLILIDICPQFAVEEDLNLTIKSDHVNKEGSQVCIEDCSPPISPPCYIKTLIEIWKFLTLNEKNMTYSPGPLRPRLYIYNVANICLPQEKKHVLIESSVYKD
jgi:hypothetical protein